MKPLFLLIGSLILIALAAVPARGAQTHLPRCGLLIDPSLGNAPATTLFEASFAQDPGIVAVDRSEIEKVLLEQQLQAMFSPDALAKRTAFGKIVKADLLVLVRGGQAPPEPGGRQALAPPESLELVVCETHHGLRLLTETIPVTDAPAADAERIVTAFHRALARSLQPLGTIVAVPPFASQDLMHDLDYLEDVYPRLIHQVFSGQAGVLVVEIPEAKALADELALAGGEQVQREMPFYLTGQYRHEGVGDALRVTLTLEFGRAGTKLEKVTLARLSPAAAPAALQSAAVSLLKKTGAPTTAPASPDAAVEARELADEADSFILVGDWHEARVLAEASLLLDPHNLKMHAVIFRALNESTATSGARAQFTREEAIDAELAHFRESLPHLEQYLMGTVVKLDARNSPPDGIMVDRYWTPIRWELQEKFLPPEQRWIDADREANAMAWRVLHHKSEAKVDDQTLEVVFGVISPWRRGELTEAEADAYVKAMLPFRLSLLKEFSYRKHAKSLWKLLLAAWPEEQADPQWPAFLEEAAKIANPEVTEWVARYRAQKRPARIAAQKPLSAPAVAATQKAVPASPDAEITFEPLKFPAPPGLVVPDLTRRFIGCLPLADGVDIFWTRYLIYTMKEKGVLGPPALGSAPPWPKGESDPNDGNPSWMWLERNSACFDGKYVWFFMTMAPPAVHRLNDDWDLGPRIAGVGYGLIALDVKHSKVIVFGKAQGLPPGASAIVGLAPGKVCIAGFFGRTWCAVVSDSHDLDGGVSLKVVYEARKVPADAGAFSTDDLSMAYRIDKLYALKAPSEPPATNAATKPAKLILPRVLVHRQGSFFFLLDPNTGATGKVPGAPKPLTDAFVHDDTIYWKGYFHPESVKFFMSRSSGPDLVNDPKPWEVPSCQFIVDQDHVGHFFDTKTGKWFVSRNGSSPLRALRGEIPVGSRDGRVWLSNHYGMIITNTDSGNEMLQVRFPKPLPEAQAAH